MFGFIKNLCGNYSFSETLEVPFAKKADAAIDAAMGSASEIINTGSQKVFELITVLNEVGDKLFKSKVAEATDAPAAEPEVAMSEVVLKTGSAEDVIAAVNKSTAAKTSEFAASSDNSKTGEHPSATGEVTEVSMSGDTAVKSLAEVINGKDHRE